MDDQPREDAAGAMATTLASVRRQLEGMEGLHSTLVRSVNVEDVASQDDLWALGRISEELGRMQRRWEKSIDIGTITSHANVEVLQRLRDDDPSLTKLAVCRERLRGRRVLGEEGDSGFEYYCPSDPKDLRFTGAWWTGAFIGSNKNLRELVVYGSSFEESNNSLSKFLAGVSRNRSIRELWLRGIDLSNGDILWKLRLFVENNANLRRIEVSRCHFGGEGDRDIASMLRGCQSLQEFTIRDNLWGGEQPTRTIAALRSHAQLVKLHLANANVGSAECRSLAALPCFSNLRHLRLASNNIDDDGVEALMRALTNGNRLQELDLSQNPAITTRGLRSLAAMLESPTTSLAKLNLLWNGVDDEGANILARALANNDKLKVLGLVMPHVRQNDNLITVRGWQAFADVLCNTSSVEATYRSNHTLRWFSLAKISILSSIGDEGGGASLSSLVFSLRMNRRGARKVARRKIIEHHLGSDEGMCHFAGMDRAVLPRALAWVPGDELSLLYRVVRNLHSEIGFVPTSVEAPAAAHRPQA